MVAAEQELLKSCPPPADELLPESVLLVLPELANQPLLQRAGALGRSCLANFDMTDFIDRTSIGLLCFTLDAYKTFDRKVIAKIIPFN